MRFIGGTGYKQFAHFSAVGAEVVIKRHMGSFQMMTAQSSREGLRRLVALGHSIFPDCFFKGLDR